MHPTLILHIKNKLKYFYELANLQNKGIWDRLWLDNLVEYKNVLFRLDLTIFPTKSRNLSKFLKERKNI